MTWRGSVRGTPFFANSQTKPGRATVPGPDNQDCGSTSVHPSLILPFVAPLPLASCAPSQAMNYPREARYVSATLAMTLDNAIQRWTARIGVAMDLQWVSGIQGFVSTTRLFLIGILEGEGGERKSWRDRIGGRDNEITYRARWNESERQSRTRARKGMNDEIRAGIPPMCIFLAEIG
jgi:hypothetical protein